MACSGSVGYLNLSPNGVVIVDNNQVAVNNDLEKRIAYLDKAIPFDKAFTFTVEDRHPGSICEYSFELGVTTCTKEKILNGSYHMYETCQQPYDCQSSSLTKKIGKTRIIRNHPKTVKITKSRDTGCLLDILIDGRIKLSINDTNNHMQGKDLIVFVIFSGSARRIRVSESPHIPGNIQIAPDGEFQSQWIVSKGIEIDGSIIHRKQYGAGSFYAYHIIPFSIGKELQFVIKEIDPNWPGLLTIGITKLHPDTIELDFSLPSDPKELNSNRDYKLYWRAFVDPFPEAQVGKNISIKRTPLGIICDYGSASKIIVKKVNLGEGTNQWYFFLHFSGKISRIQFNNTSQLLNSTMPFYNPNTVVRASNYSNPKICLVCDQSPVSRAVFPCGHKFFCESCSSKKFSDCMVCNQKIE